MAAFQGVIMWEKIKIIAVTVLATLGVLFIVIMLIPMDEEDAEGSTLEVRQEQAEVDSEENQEEPVALATEQESSEVIDMEQEIIIPEELLSEEPLSFRTTTLGNEPVTEDLFSDYDITVVHIWGTYCTPCLAEMNDYTAWVRNLPSNVNLIGIVCDAYDGIDSNTEEAEEILSNAGADFLNLRTSDSLYDLVASMQRIPSSFFVDRSGRMIGSVLVGESFEETKAQLEAYFAYGEE